MRGFEPGGAESALRADNLRAIGVLGLVTASLLWLAAAALLAPDRLAWVAAGHLAPTPRLTLLGIVGGGTLLTLVAGLGFVLRHPAGAPRLHSWARLLAPLALAGLLPLLFARPAWPDEMGLLIAAGGAGLLLCQLLTPALEELEVASWFRGLSPERARRLGWLLTGLLALFYAVAVSRLTIISHLNLGTRHSDLSELHGVFYNTLHGHPFRSPAAFGDLRDWAFLRVHAVFIVYPLLPLYALAPRPETLLVLQAVAVALTVLPLYAFAQPRVGPALAVGFVAAFLLWPAVQRPNFYDFHFLALSPPLVMTVICLVDRWRGADLRRPGPALALAGTTLLVLITREDLSVGLAALGLVVALSGRSLALGSALAAVSTAYFVVVKLWLMPQFGSYWFAGLYQQIAASGFEGTTGVIVGLLSHPGRVLPFVLSPEKLLYVMHLAAPLVFLWWRRPWLWLALVPGALFTLVVTDRGLWIQFQYAYFFAPYVIAASVIGAELALRPASPGPTDAGSTPDATAAAGVAPGDRTRRWALLGGLLFASVIASSHYGALLGNRTIRAEFGKKQLSHSPEARARYAQLQELIARLPPDAPVTASEYVSPHVSNRLDVFRLLWGVPQQSTHVLVERRLLPGERAPLLRAVRSEPLSLAAQNDGFLLFTRTGPPADVATIARLIEVVDSPQR